MGIIHKKTFKSINIHCIWRETSNEIPERYKKSIQTLVVIGRNSGKECAFSVKCSGTVFSGRITMRKADGWKLIEEKQKQTNSSFFASLFEFA